MPSQTLPPPLLIDQQTNFAIRALARGFAARFRYTPDGRIEGVHVHAEIGGNYWLNVGKNLDEANEFLDRLDALMGGDAHV